MKYRTALNRGWGVVSLLWIAWCLYWPLFARRQDWKAIEAERGATYKLCLQQKGMTPAGCAADRDAYTKLDERLAWPPERNVYLEFAGANGHQAGSLLTVLCLFPVLFGYTLLRVVLEAVLWYARARPQDAAARY